MLVAFASCFRAISARSSDADLLNRVCCRLSPALPAVIRHAVCLTFCHYSTHLSKFEVSVAVVCDASTTISLTPATATRYWSVTQPPAEAKKAPNKLYLARLRMTHSFNRVGIAPRFVFQISNFKFQISNLKSQISNTKYEISNRTITARWARG